jgi:hypothetical protein
MNPTTTQGRRRRCGAFAMIVAVALVALVALALGAVLSLFRLDLNRTADALEQAQLRQMLLAGQREARGQLESARAGAQPVALALPASLSAQGGALEFGVAPEKGPDGAAAAEVTVRAALGRRTMTQTLGYEKGPQGWRVTRATLSPAGGA